MDAPLSGIRVVDMSHEWAGPHCTRILADFGAEVICVEYPRRLGLLRGGRTESRQYDRQPPWHQVGRNKYSVTLDLGRSRDREIMADLIATADVFVENGRAGVAERLGFGWDQVRALRPDIVFVAMPAYGHTGPWAERPAYGAALEALSGVQSLTAYGPGEKPERIRELDVINGLGAACATLTALLHRAQTGEGQYVDFSQMEFPTHALLGEHMLEYAMNGTHAPALGNRHRRYAPQGCYPSQGDDAWITVTVRSDAEWRRLCDALGRADWLSDTRFATSASRMAHHDELDRMIAEWTRARTAEAAMRELQAHAVAAGVVMGVADLAEDRHLAARGYFQEGDAGGRWRLPGLPLRMGAFDGRIRWRGPDLGEHNAHALGDLLGRPASDLPPLDGQQIGTAYDPE